MKINFTIPAVQATYHLLSNTDPKGRTEIRLHSKLFRILDKECTIDGGINAKATEVEIEETISTYLKEILRKKVETGIPGQLARGYDDIQEAIETK